MRSAHILFYPQYREHNGARSTDRFCVASLSCLADVRLALALAGYGLVMAQAFIRALKAAFVAPKAKRNLLRSTYTRSAAKRRYKHS